MSSPDKQNYKGVKNWCVFLSGSFIQHSEASLRELGFLSGYIIGGHNLESLTYSDNTVLIEDTDRKLQKHQTDVSEGKQKEKLNKLQVGSVNGC